MRNRYTNLGWLITIFVAVIPITIWMVSMPAQFDTAKNISDNLGRLAGLAGMALFAWNVILSARLKIYNKLFMGLDNTYRAHHIIGCLALILLLIHPLLITFRYFLSSPISAYEFVKPGLESPFKNLGVIALYCMIALMVVTLYMHVAYKRFVLAQRLLGLVLFLGGIHAFFVGGSDLAIKTGMIGLQIYYLLLIGLAAVVYVYRSLFHGNFSKYLDYSLYKIIPLGNSYELQLSPQGKPLVFAPGQFAFIKLELDGVLGESHPFSMSSGPNDKSLNFGIKNLGDYTALLATAESGTKVKIDGPYGTFSNAIVKNPRQIWIAGGIGVTPFVSMAKALEDGQSVDLYYCAKTKDEAVYLSTLEKIASRKSNLKIILFTESQNNYLTASYIQKNSKSLDGANYMICGPPSMMKSLKAQLKKIGIKKRNINTEEFDLS